jgi:hypothetical protein
MPFSRPTWKKARPSESGKKSGEQLNSRPGASFIVAQGSSSSTPKTRLLRVTALQYRGTILSVEAKRMTTRTNQMLA